MINQEMLFPGFLLVPEVGIEPTRAKARWILSPVRLPVSPLRRKGGIYPTFQFYVKNKRSINITNSGNDR